jgi:hypothetical protein
MMGGWNSYSQQYWRSLSISPRGGWALPYARTIF